MYKNIKHVLEMSELYRELILEPKGTIGSYIEKESEGYENIAIWGMGEHTEKLLELVDLQKMNIECFIDINKNKWGKTYLNKNIYGPSGINDLKIDLIIISSFYHRKEIEQNILQSFPEIDYIDIYEKFEYNHKFYDEYLVMINYNFYMKTCFLIEHDIQEYGIILPEDIKLKLKRVIENNSINYNFLKEKINIKENDYLDKIVEIDKSKIKVVFLTQASRYWSSTESVWKEFSNDENFDVKVIQLPYFIRYKYGVDYNESRSFLVNNKIKFIPWYIYDLKQHKPDIVFFQSPYEYNKPKVYSAETFKEYGIRFAYIPYALEFKQKFLLNRISSEYTSTLPAMRDSWKVFLRSEQNKKLYQEYLDREEDFIVTGHPKFDYIVNYKKNRLEILKKYDHIKDIEKKKIIIWNPLRLFYDKKEIVDKQIMILEAIKKYKDILVIFRPHPSELEKFKSEEKTDDEAFEYFKKELLKNKYIVLDSSVDYRESFTISHGLMTFMSALMVEYLATEKPIMYTSMSENDCLDDEERTILDLFYKGDTKEEIEVFLENIKNSEDPLLQKRLSNMDKHIYKADGKSGFRIKEYVKNELKTLL